MDFGIARNRANCAIAVLLWWTLLQSISIQCMSKHTKRKRKGEMRETHKLIPSIRRILPYSKFKIARIAYTNEGRSINIVSERHDLWFWCMNFDFVFSDRPNTHTFNHKVIQNSVESFSLSPSPTTPKLDFRRSFSPFSIKFFSNRRYLSYFFPYIDYQTYRLWLWYLRFGIIVFLKEKRSKRNGLAYLCG